MNFYERHIGDFIKDTVHLSMLEDGAYNRLLDQYYANEKPLPADFKKVCKLARALSKPERDAVATVLGEFFELHADGYRHKRCDAVISEYQEGEPDREAKKLNQNARQKRTRERRAAVFDELSSHGIYPEWNTPLTELKAILSRVTGRDTSHLVTREATATNTHYPDNLNNTHTAADSPAVDNSPQEPHPVAPARDIAGDPAHWRPASDQLAARLVRAGIPPPDPSQLPRLLGEFQDYHAGKRLTDGQCYVKFINWIRRARDEKPASTSSGTHASSSQQARKPTPSEQVIAANRQFLIDNGIDPDGDPVRG